MSLFSGRSNTALSPLLTGFARRDAASYQRVSLDPRLGINLARMFFPLEAAVEGLGVETRLKSSETEERAKVKSKKMASLNQAELGWSDKIAIGNLISQYELTNKAQTYSDNAVKINYLKSILKPGDIIFTTGGGKGQGMITEILDLCSRIIGSRNKADLSFPFTHVLICVGDNQILDLSSSGARTRSLEEIFIKRQYYDCIGVGSLQLPRQEIELFVKKAIETSKRITAFNTSWFLFSSIFEIRKDRSDTVDTSVKGNKGVCVDYVTEPARVLSGSNSKISGLAKCVNVLQVFEYPLIRVKAAINLERD